MQVVEWDRTAGRAWRRVWRSGLALALVLSACGGGDDPTLSGPVGIAGKDGGAEGGVDAKADTVVLDAKQDTDATVDAILKSDTGQDAKQDGGGAGSGPDGSVQDAEAGQETSTEAGDAGCPTGSVLCGGACVVLTKDPSNCGACGVVCSGGQVCNVGQCASSCGPLLTDCSGACVSLSSDPANCGSCGNSCALAQAAAACTSTKCTIAYCAVGYADCNGNPTDGCEINTETDPNNCGGCGAPCVLANATPSCASGQCAVGTCKPGYADCDGVAANGCEVNLQTSGTNCGGCGAVCAAGTVCSGGSCAGSCAAGETNCGGSCVTLLSDPSNCGQCSQVCVAPQGTPGCVSGSCVVASCAVGFADCNSLVADGCEVNVATSPANCGSCGQACLLPNAVPLCSSGLCTVASCAPGFADCNGVAIDGCEINLATDGSNCGSCGTACSLPNATPVCNAGQCAVAACQPGYADCNGQVADGCEALVSSDVLNCGACGQVCLFPQALESCSSGTCVVAGCEVGYADCDGEAADGCETAIASDAANCGGCGKVCNLPNASAGCASGQCVVSSCLTGYANCDSVAANGCEANLVTDPLHCGACGTACQVGLVCSTGQCASQCATGLTNCSGACVSLTSDPLNCGSCGTVCNLPNATETCVNSQCAIAGCDAGFADCNTLAADGCEVNLQVDLANCGACGKLCALPNATESCTSGQCLVVTCTTGYVDCDGLAANGCEVNTQTDPSNCGGCGSSCSLPNATASCTLGVCTIASCNTGFGDCNGLASDGCEMNLTASMANCGACGNLCALPNATATCSAGVCTINNCKPGYADCNSNPADGCESQLATDVNNCGSCGAACNLANATSSCSAGQCTVASCNSGYADCDGVAANGCEANLQTDVQHCGTCATICAVGQVCNSGVCSNSCAAGLTNCSGSCVNLATDTANCGSCGFLCALPNAVEGCSAGTCTVVSCTPGFANCDGIVSNGCEVNLATDANNCGACGTVCTLPNATAGCSAGSCLIASCNTGYGDCNSLPADGCEVNTASDLWNCGGCSRLCSSTHVASKSCTAGVCTSTCQLGYGNCSQPAAPAPDDGCELAVSANNTSCGSCANNCSLQGGGSGLVCDGSSRPKNQCGCSSHGACSAAGSQGTCNVALGICSCEGTACRPGEYCVKSGNHDICTCNGSSQCSAGQTCCQTPAGCRDLSTDAQSCGACGHACPPSFACSAGLCGCTSNASCSAGSSGVCSGGTCSCGGTACAPGQRCLTGGICG